MENRKSKEKERMRRKKTQKISSYVINYPFLGLTKLPFGAKFMIKYPRKGKKEVFKCPIYACALILHLNIDTCIIF